MKKREPSLRRIVRIRARDCCEYCRLPAEFDPLPFHLEHIIPKKRGVTEASNLALSCSTCNLHKSSNLAGLDPEDGAMTRLFHPRTDAWISHFEWNNALLVGRNPVGRTTIDVWKINAPERVKLREIVLALNEFPSQRWSDEMDFSSP